MRMVVGQHRQPPPEGLLPGYQPTIRILIVNELSRHKRCVISYYKKINPDSTAVCE